MLLHYCASVLSDKRDSIPLTPTASPWHWIVWTWWDCHVNSVRMSCEPDKMRTHEWKLNSKLYSWQAIRTPRWVMSVLLLCTHWSLPPCNNVLAKRSALTSQCPHRANTLAIFVRLYVSLSPLSRDSTVLTPVFLYTLCFTLLSAVTTIDVARRTTPGLLLLVSPFPRWNPDCFDRPPHRPTHSAYTESQMSKLNTRLSLKLTIQCSLVGLLYLFDMS